ncbi:hypothetical protein P0M04_01240 [Telluria mixta]|nr:hypothetical protein [Telluria mixta]WEM96403.1 hypothetical protein P0M04_01240 [Telluria mixta]
MNTNDLLKAVMQLDLEPIKTKLMHVESGEGWSLEKANAVEKEYRRFLCLMKLYPEEDTAPLVDVDTFWHYHILDTMKYAKDCEQAFGYFLHHYPYVGMRGDDDDQFRLDSGERMRELYEATFGEDYPGAPVEAAASPVSGDAAGNGTAWCAGPRIDAAAGNGTAWCAGPRVEAASGSGTAWCAGPRVEAASGNGTAWCAGPRVEAQAKRAEGAISAGTAWCAGPRLEVRAKGTQAASGVATAWCAGPRVEAKVRSGEGAVSAATAWCAGPRAGGAIGAATAWCAGPRGASRAA